MDVDGVIISIIGVLITVAIFAAGLVSNRKSGKREAYEKMLSNVYMPLYELVWNKECVNKCACQRIYNAADRIMVNNLHDTPFSMIRKTRKCRDAAQTDESCWKKDYNKWRKIIISNYWYIRIKLGHEMPSFNTFDYRYIKIKKAFLSGTIIFYTSNILRFIYQYYNDANGFLDNALPFIKGFVEYALYAIYYLSFAYILLTVFFMFYIPRRMFSISTSKNVHIKPPMQVRPIRRRKRR